MRRSPAVRRKKFPIDGKSGVREFFFAKKKSIHDSVSANLMTAYVSRLSFLKRRMNGTWKKN
jgi:hypothetical protein